MTRAGTLSIVLIALAFAGASVGPADADIVVDVPGVATADASGTPADVPPGHGGVPPGHGGVPPGQGGVPPGQGGVPPGHGGLKVQVPSVEVAAGPRDGSRPPGESGPGNGAPTPATPVSTPTTPDPPAATTATAAAATNPQPAAPTPAPKTVPVARSQTIASLTRSGTAPRRTKKRPQRVVAKTTFVAHVALPAATASHATKHTRTPHTAAPRKQVARPRPPRTIGTAIGDVVDALPGWVLGIFVGFAALAAAMAIDAYLSSRRARGLAIQRAGLVDDVGHLQAALLAPIPPMPEDVSLSVAYRPAAGLAAGGDFYDVFELDADRTGMLLGDVSGHGRESVAHAALVRYTLRTFIAAGHEPAEAIALTDHCLDGHMGDQFATVIAAIYDHGAQTVTYAKAGHYPPLVLGADDDATAASGSPPIGAGLGARPRDVTIDLDPGATVCFFTDGLVEARRNGVPVGPECVERILAEAPGDADALIAAVAAEADELNDDVAVCVLHRPVEHSPLAVNAAGPTPVPEPVAG